jgi:hypothetical protein
MCSGLFGILGLLFMRETYGPVILQKKTIRLRKETGNEELRSKLDIGLSNKDFFLRSIVRPCKMLIFSPVVLGTSVYVGVVYGYVGDSLILIYSLRSGLPRALSNIPHFIPLTRQ